MEEIDDDQSFEPIHFKQNREKKIDLKLKW